MRRELLTQNIKPFVKYCIVGVAGTSIDVVVLFLLVRFATLPLLIATTISFLAAVVNNFYFNKQWTFRNTSRNYRKLFIKFFIVSVVGLLITLLSMRTLVFGLGVWYIASKLMTSVLVMLWNFLANNIWTFRTPPLPTKPLIQYPHDLSIVIPAYNEQERLGETLGSIETYIREKNINAELIVVDDGSTDATSTVVQSYQHRIANLRCVSLPRNHGKGFAVKQGIQKSTGKHILFTDADHSTPIDELDALLSTLKRTNAGVVIGSRYAKESVILRRQPPLRVAIGRIGNFFIRSFLIDGISDTQCGFKLFVNAAAQDIFSFQKIQRFGFDVEILIVAQNLGYHIEEVPVRWINSTGTRFRPVKDSMITFLELLYIKFNLWCGRYDRE